jgi:ribosomal protein S18 acetylase RimI-like enzyme
VPEGERERALAFLRALDRSRAERLEDLPGGAVAVFADSLPLVHDQNKVLAPPGLGLGDLPALVEETERVQRAGGLRHRKIAFDDEQACEPAVVQWFQKRGWRQRPLRVMVHRGPVLGSAADDHAVEVSPEALAPAAYAFALEEPWGRSPEARRQVVAGDKLTALAIAERGFAVYDGDSIAAYCRLYSDDEIGQIENVTTLMAYRQRGYAKALVGMALRESLAANDLTFLIAEGADWPRHFYARMGFEDVGGYCEFNRLGA